LRNPIQAFCRSISNCQPRSSRYKSPSNQCVWGPEDWRSKHGPHRPSSHISDPVLPLQRIFRVSHCSHLSCSSTVGYNRITISLLFLHHARQVLARNTRFQTFFPVYSKSFTEIRDGPCRDYFAQKEAGAAVCHNLLNCMLENTSDVIKGDMASGMVALGLMPTLLIFLSSSTAETTLLSRRRPLLALLLAIGSPAVQPPPIFSFPDPTEMMNIKDDHILARHYSSWQAVLISIA
jgi:hypothetical protein